jgi:hypothetical protein
MGRACGIQGTDAKMHTKFCSESLKIRGHSEGLGIDGRIILESILEKK